jgi:hypothetical protein
VGIDSQRIEIEVQKIIEQLEKIGKPFSEYRESGRVLMTTIIALADCCSRIAFATFIVIGGIVVGTHFVGKACHPAVLSPVEVKPLIEKPLNPVDSSTGNNGVDSATSTVGGRKGN